MMLYLIFRNELAIGVYQGSESELRYICESLNNVDQKLERPTCPAKGVGYWFEPTIKLTPKTIETLIHVLKVS